MRHILNCTKYQEEMVHMIQQIHGKIDKKCGTNTTSAKCQWGQVLKRIWTLSTLTAAHSGYRSTQPFITCKKCKKQGSPCGSTNGTTKHYTLQSAQDRARPVVEGFDDTSSRWLAKLLSIGWDGIWKGVFSKEWNKANQHYGVEAGHSR